MSDEFIELKGWNHMSNDNRTPPRLICPHCGFSAKVPSDKLPRKPVRATCPRCREAFTFDPAALSEIPPQAEALSPPLPPQPPRQSGPSTEAPPSSSPRPPRRGPTSPVGRTGLRGITELMAAAWTIFQARFGVLFAIYLITLLSMVGPPLLGAGMGTLLLMALPFGKGGVMALCTGIGGIAGVLGSFWGCGALLAAVLDDRLDLRGSFSAGKKKMLALLWVCLLTGFVVTGGFLLFVIPGIIFSVWFMFAPLVLLDDDSTGMSALLKSRALVQGRWFDIFLRLVVIWGFSALVAAIPVAGALLLLVVTPYLVLVQAIIYKDLKRAAEPVSYGCSFGDMTRWPAVASIGFIALPAALFGMFGMSLLAQLQPLSGKVRFEATTLDAGSQARGTREGEWRVIPIPGQGQQQSPAPSQSDASASPASSPFPLQADPQRDKAPENIHVFIYAVNCPGRVLANGVELKQIEDKPDMQYNYNMSGDKLRYGQNTITVEYSPAAVTGNMLKPQIHIKISDSSGGQRQVLGDWRVEETSPGQKSFDLEVPNAPTQP